MTCPVCKTTDGTHRLATWYVHWQGWQDEYRRRGFRFKHQRVPAGYGRASTGVVVHAYLAAGYSMAASCHEAAEHYLR